MKYFIADITAYYDNTEWGLNWLAKADSIGSAVKKFKSQAGSHKVEYVKEISPADYNLLSDYFDEI